MEELKLENILTQQVNLKQACKPGTVWQICVGQLLRRRKRLFRFVKNKRTGITA